ncbi:Zinc finger C2H2 [Penicillium fimorum]|uniref:Zinc finger C2H2 n=1 Tax=Penicillium fimorum TaxID=1882269 RepID=A0A9W9XSU0_9EURO|nr:Zinc finger C2H2 [Penicillium fimorum]
MGTALDALSAPPLNIRRPAAPTLPSFELPPPPFTLGDHATPQPLAPSTGASSELPPAYWSGANPYGQSWAPGVNQYSRSSFSPSGMQRSVISPPTTDGLPHPYEGPTLSYQPLPAPSTMPPSASQPAMAMYHGHATSPAPLPSNDPYAPKHQHMYAASPPMHSPHQAGFSSMYGPAGLGIHPPGRMPVHSPGGQPPLGYPRQPWPSYSLPAMNGPVMTNVHSPSGPMSMMGMQSGLLPGFNSGHAASSQHLYGGHPPPHGMSAPTADRPFKCDQCPQSFNRNHDLKRHKRIHLAVKPFPCSHCDKSFSRKDALKRHILVKGCGKDGDSDANSNQTGTDIKGEGRSEDGSPLLNGR